MCYHLTFHEITIENQLIYSLYYANLNVSVIQYSISCILYTTSRTNSAINVIWFISIIKNHKFIKT